jgi:hypothetical protein
MDAQVFIRVGKGSETGELVVWGKLFRSSSDE